jgi:hypothetical protein
VSLATGLAPGRLLRQGAAHWALFFLLSVSLLWLRTWEADGGAGFMLYLAVAWAVLCGIALSHIIHEWGHFLGAVLSRSMLSIKARLHPLFFDFDYSANSRRQFLALGYGGLLGNVLLLSLLMLVTVPPATLLEAGLLAAVVGQLVYVLVLELPVSLGIRAGRDPLETLASHFGQGRPLFRRAGLAGVAAALLTALGCWLLA